MFFLVKNLFRTFKKKTDVIYSGLPLNKPYFKIFYRFRQNRRTDSRIHKKNKKRATAKEEKYYLDLRPLQMKKTNTTVIKT